MARTWLMAIFAAALLLAPTAPAQTPARETLTNTQVVTLVAAGLAPDVIVAKIRASASRFDISTPALVALKSDNVPDVVITAMVDAVSRGGGPLPTMEAASSGPAVDARELTAPHAPGIYLAAGADARPSLQILDPTVADDTRTSNVFGWFFSYGVVPLKSTTILAGPTAHVAADSLHPTFYFYFNRPGSGLYQNGLGVIRLPGPHPTPALFILTRFQSVNGEREALTQQIGPAGVQENSEVQKAEISCTYEEIAPGVFKVTPDADLAPGEYAWAYWPDDTDSDGDDTPPARFFDFSAPG